MRAGLRALEGGEGLGGGGGGIGGAGEMREKGFTAEAADMKEPVNFWRGTLVVEAVIVEEPASWSWKDFAERAFTHHVGRWLSWTGLMEWPVGGCLGQGAGGR